MKKAIVIVSFGTADLEGFNKLEIFEKEVRDNFKNEYYICKAFTSKILSRILAEKYGKKVLILEEILDNLSNEGYKEVYIQPLFIIEGGEYINIDKLIKRYKSCFSKIILGKPFMKNDDYELRKSCNLIVNIMKKAFSKNQNIVLVGHGSRTVDVKSYEILKDVFIEQGYRNLYVGTLEGKIKKEHITKELLTNNIKDIVLVPLFLLEGNHIKKDIFGNVDSWKTYIEANNIKVVEYRKTLLEYQEIKEYYINEIRINL